MPVCGGIANPCFQARAALLYPFLRCLLTALLGVPTRSQATCHVPAPERSTSARHGPSGHRRTSSPAC